MREIPLTQSRIATVDDDDFEFLSRFKWYAIKASSGVWYAARAGPPPKKNHISMHSAIMGQPPAERLTVDHKDGDGLHNWRSNLRWATPAHQMYNRKIQSNSPSGYKGVAYNMDHSRRRPWRAKIMVDGRQIYIGYYFTAEEAARAYNEAALHYFGEFARLNAV